MCSSIENDGYIFVPNAKIWTDARSYCRQYYTDLVTIHNSEENDQVTIKVLSGWYIWFGLFLDSWEWSDQWDLRFRHWAADHPLMTSGSGDCVGMSRSNSGRWSQCSCDVQQPFICYGGEFLQLIELNDSNGFVSVYNRHHKQLKYVSFNDVSSMLSITTCISLDDKRKQIVRLKVTCEGKCALNDPSLQMSILNEVCICLKQCSNSGATTHFAKYMRSMKRLKKNALNYLKPNKYHSYHHHCYYYYCLLLLLSLLGCYLGLNMI